MLVLVAASLAGAATAQPMSKQADRRVTTEASIRQTFRCVIGKDAALAHALVADAAAWNRKNGKRFRAIMTDCIVDWTRMQGNAMRGELARAFLNHPDRIPAKAAPVGTVVLTDGVGACVARKDAATARAFIESTPGFPDQDAALATLEPAVKACLAPLGRTSITGDALRAGIAVQLYVDLLAGRAAEVSAAR
jgi:hypothetical protein